LPAVSSFTGAATHRVALLFCAHTDPQRDSIFTKGPADALMWQALDFLAVS
jgi:hypothetical protein